MMLDMFAETDENAFDTMIEEGASLAEVAFYMGYYDDMDRSFGG